MKKLLSILITAATLFTYNSSAQTLLFSEDWSSSSFSTNGWTFPNGQPNWNVGSSYTPNGGTAPNAYFNWSPSMTSYTRALESATINASAYSGSNITLNFLLQLNNYSTSTLEEFDVQVKDVSASTWTSVAYYNNTLPGIQDYSVSNVVLPGMAGQVFQLRFVAYGANSFNLNGWGLDNIEVFSSSCATVTPTMSVTASSASICANGTATLSASGALSYTWNPGNITGSTILVNPSSTTVYTVTGSMGTCTNIPAPETVTLTVLQNPTLAVSGSTSVCSGASSTLTASGASSYTWNPSATLNTNTGSVVIATPLQYTSYWVVATGSNGCSDSTYIDISVQQLPSFSQVTASPTLVCAGGSSQLSANAVLPGVYTVTAISYSLIPTPATGVTTLCASGAAVTPLTNGSLDDGDWENISLPFSFQFFGNSYSDVTIGTNGFIYPGTGSPNTYTGYGTTFPDPFSTTPCIAAIYSDLYFENTGTIEYFVDGIAPNRKFVVNFNNGEYYAGTGSLTVQTVIFETSNEIEVHTTGATGDNSQVLGIQDGNGANAYTAPGRNGTNYTVSTPDAYRFAIAPAVVNYSWSPATYLNSTSVSSPTASSVSSSVAYSVTATIAGCSSTNTLALNVAAVSASLSASTTTACTNGLSITLTGSPAGGVYAGTNVSNGVFTPGASSGTFTPAYTYTDNVSGCTATATVEIVLSTCTGINDQASLVHSIYPNPANELLNIDFIKEGVKTITVTDVAGRSVKSFTTEDNNVSLNISDLENGVYFVTFVCGTTSATSRIVKQ